MKLIDKIYINGIFEKPHGTEVADLINPATNQLIGQVTLADKQDVDKAVAAAKTAFKSFSKTTRPQRLIYLQQLHDAVMKRQDELIQATIEEYGAPAQRAVWSNQMAAQSFLHFKEVLEDFDFVKQTGKSKVILEPVGVTAIFTSWNSNAGAICVKLAAVIAAGCTAVIKPSEMSAIQTQILTECFHDAGLPAGVINIINGLGHIVGPELSRHRDIVKIAFTGSTQVGKMIAREAVDTMKRVLLELSGKSPNVILDDADFTTAIPMALNGCFMNSGQACVAASRLIVPENRLQEVKQLVIQAMQQVKVGDPKDESTTIGPLASIKQYERVQQYIKSGIEEGAELLIGGEGHPEGLAQGNFVKPTVFINVNPEMRIAKEEIFGPVLSIFTYQTQQEAIELANDSIYGLMAYVSSSNIESANQVASELVAGRVLINTLHHDPFAPFGGFKESGIGREGGIYGLEEFLEPKAIITA